MIKAICSGCSHEFEFDPKPQMTPGNEVAKFGDYDETKSWTVLIVCPKCNRRRFVQIGEQ